MYFTAMDRSLDPITKTIKSIKLQSMLNLPLSCININVFYL